MPDGVKGLANLLALDDFGGLQTLYVSWAASHQKQFASVPLTIHRTRREPLSYFHQLITEAGGTLISPALDQPDRSPTAKLYQHFLTFVLGGSRRASLHRELGRYNIRTLLLWNALPERALERNGRKLIVYDHGLSWIERPSLLNAEWMKRADGFISVSKASEAMLRQRWGVESPIEVLTNPLRLESGEKIQPERRERSAGLRLGVAGRLVSFKGFSSAINAVSVLKRRGVDTTLVLAGDGPEKTRLSDLAGRLGVATRIEFMGGVHAMDAFYNDIDILLCPSLREPFGLVSLEASARGIPTILANVDGLPETVEHQPASILINPSVPISDYIEMGGSIEKMPEVVYNPSSGKIEPPLALDPVAIADSVEQIVSAYPSFIVAAGIASEKIRHNRDIDDYSRKLAAIVKRFQCAV